MSVIQGSELNYASDLAQHGQHTLHRVLPLGSSKVDLNPTASSEATFEIPNRVYNLARSQLDFTMTVPAEATHVNNIHCRGALNMFDRVSLTTRSGIYICDLLNASEFSSAMSPYLTKQADMERNDTGGAGIDKSRAQGSGKSGAIFPSNDDSITGQAVTDGYSKQGQRIVWTGSAGVTGPPSKKEKEQCYIKSSTDGGAMTLVYSIPLKEVYHSIMSVDRDMYFAQSLLLKVQFAPANKLGFATDDFALANPSSIAGTVAIEDLELKLAVETNAKVVSSIVSRVSTQGLQLVCPYVYSYKFTSQPNTTSHSITQRINASYGQRLLSVYNVCHNSSGDSIVAHDFANKNDATGTAFSASGEHRIKNFNSELDNQLLQQYVVNSEKAEDYQIMKPMLNNSCIENYDQYRHSYVWVDSFRDGQMCDWLQSDTVIDGIPLQNERIYSLNRNTATVSKPSYNNYTWFVCQRTLTVDPSGIIVMN